MCHNLSAQDNHFKKQGSSLREFFVIFVYNLTRMKTRILLLLCFLYCLRTVSTAQNINISNYTFHDMEPYIAVNPTNPNNVIAAWMKLTGISEISIAVSS